MKKSEHRKSKVDLKKQLSDLERECKEKTKLAEQYLNQLKYAQADFENLQKRIEREKAEHVKYANKELILDLLPVLDSIEKAIESKIRGKDAEGMEAISKQFYTVLEGRGLKRIEAVGKKFDPYYHEAVSKEKCSKEEGTILEELQRGYLFNSKVIRHTKVKVSGGM